MNEKEHGIMNKEAVDEMIKHQGIYEIRYKKDDKVTVWHISNIEFSPKYGDSCILAYCIEAGKDLTFSVSRILSLQRYWIDFESTSAGAPCDGVYLIARMNPGMGGGIDYQVCVLKEGDSFVVKAPANSLPFAYHYIHPFGTPEVGWEEKKIIMKKWEHEKILAPKDGIPIIAFREPRKETELPVPTPVQYCIGNGDEYDDYRAGPVWGGVSKNDDISTSFKDSDTAGYTGWLEKWEGYEILGFLMVCEYDRRACPQHVRQWQATM